MSDIDKRWLVKSLEDCGALKYGEFTLTSGKKSNYYVDIKTAVTRPELLDAIAKGMARYAAGYSRIAGVELGAIPIAAAVALETRIPFIMVRKEKKEHGTQKAFEGKMIKGERVLFVEDVVTTGGTLARAIQSMRDAGALIDMVVCVVDRGEGGKEKLAEIGISLLSLITAEDLQVKT